jgi:GTP-binding protein Era
MMEEERTPQEDSHQDSDDVLNQYLSKTGGGIGTAPGYRSGYVAVVGKPNVGKSTLINAIVGRKVAITSNKPQTTRRRILGILTREDAQILFVDTPGIHEPKQALNRYMMREVEEALDDCDAVLFVTDVSRPPDDEDSRVAERVRGMKQPVIQALNKADMLDPRHVVENVAAHEELMDRMTKEESASADEAIAEGTPFEIRNSVMLTSAARGDNIDKLLAMLIVNLPEGPAYYDPGQYTDQTERILAAEFVREQALRYLEQEVPHGIAVSIDEWQPRKNGMIYIGATIFVERDSQKGILIGKGGEMLKKIGSGARKEIERELGTKVFLELWAKVREGWRKDDSLVERFLSGQG